MKRILLSAVVLVGLCASVGSVNVAHANLLPPCTVSVYPPYTVPVTLECDPWTLPNGTTLNAIEVKYP